MAENTEVVEERVSSPENIDDAAPISRREALDSFMDEPLRTLEAHGVLFQALNGVTYSKFKTLQSSALSGYKANQRMEKQQIVEEAALLTVSVVDPVLNFDEWLFKLGKTDHYKTQLLIDTAREVCNLETDQVHLAKKLLSEMRESTPS